MTNQHTQVDALLRELRGELERTRCANEDAQQRVDGLIREIDDILASPEEERPARYRSLRARLNDDVELLEATHPSASWVVQRLIATLVVAGL